MGNNYILDTKPDRKVDYIMITRDGTRVKSATSYESAQRMLYGDVRATDDIPGYPLTADGKYFFAGFMEKQDKGVLE